MIPNHRYRLGPPLQPVRDWFEWLTDRSSTSPTSRRGPFPEHRPRFHPHHLAHRKCRFHFHRHLPNLHLLRGQRFRRLWTLLLEPLTTTQKHHLPTRTLPCHLYSPD